MRIAITDANIFIDLHTLNCLDWLVSLGLEVHTTDVILSELTDEQKAAVIEVVTVVQSLSFDDLIALQNLNVSKGLSVPDQSAIWYSKVLSAPDMLILTNDNLIRKWCKTNKVEVHGIIWLFDDMIDAALLTKSQATLLLKELMKFNQWLPDKECAERLEKWSASK